MYFYFFLQIENTFIYEIFLVHILVCCVHSVPCAKDLAVNADSKSLDLLKISKIGIKIEDCCGLEAKCWKCIQREWSTVWNSPERLINMRSENRRLDFVNWRNVFKWIESRLWSDIKLDLKISCTFIQIVCALWT